MNADEGIDVLVKAMRFKLAVNAHKGDIGELPPAKAIELLMKEVEELREAVSRGNRVDMMLEAADVCNFALAAVMNALAAERNKQRNEGHVGALENALTIGHDKPRNEGHTGILDAAKYVPAAPPFGMGKTGAMS